MALRAQHQGVIFSVGDTVTVDYKIIEDKKERIQPFTGVVLGIKGEKENKSFVVRKIASDNVGVERIFPLNSPWIKNIKILKEGKVRRAKLNYLRNRTGKAALYVKEKTKIVKPVAKKKTKTKKESKKTTK